MCILLLKDMPIQVMPESYLGVRKVIGDGIRSPSVDLAWVGVVVPTIDE